MTEKSKLANNISRLFLFVFITVIFSKFAYENRCHVINCSPASWERILDIAFAQLGNDFRIEYISAHPSRTWNSYTEIGPTFIDIDVSYVSLKIDNSFMNGQTNHPVKNLVFDDQNLITNIYTRGSWSNYVPSEDIQEKLQRVTVHPRDAFRLTWALAKQESSLSADNAFVSATLYLNNIEKVCGCESIWSVEYMYKNIDLIYYINAQTGQIVSSKKTSF